MTTRILLNGCNGRMGRVISDALSGSGTCPVVAGIDINDKPLFAYPVFSSLKDCDVDFDVIIDFSNPQALPGICDFALLKKKSLVIATTGLTQEHKEIYKEAAKEIPVFVSANMSLGINVLISLAKKATAVLNEDFDIEILEAHHNRKIDSPSGTALMIADAINETANNRYYYSYDRHQKRELRSKEEIGIHSIRGGTIIGDHTVFFSGSEEVLEITHRAQSRNVFAQGAIAAAKYVAFKSPGLYSMADLIG